jgi:hypothetical protein
MNSQRTVMALAGGWVLVALVYGLMLKRGIAVTALPIVGVMWFAIYSERLTQSTQLAMPVLMLPGTLMCLVGCLQALGYGAMSDEPMLAFSAARFVFFFVGLVLHFVAYWMLANESRASDHLSGERATKV